ncbi:lipoprotein-releasing ABC transporter permease subunit LolE [Sodalis endosymbiont of Henestaris halophilus]|uniref:lipoprotein-releasing ABC transporter permease subunit LolE n=1 Tax=Sodalis endosymbiont of Henestaris halophilus TaxID=1929246 RepID=UPI000BC0A7AE|nr:lipoprotein-releasing ABC transporter permease subunit LolE [Sodalis endosymbiont of Henestaris halophilus]SNC58960.1 Lipoprotein-releasing system transmembrane protein LolE [Sodalis endosymbiont of Henestaris halophilus]
MKIPLSLQIAIRFSRGRQGSIISLMSIISIIGISLGVAVLIIGLSAMNGFEREVKHRILAVVPHIEIESVHQPFTDWPTMLKSIEQGPGILAVAPYLKFTGLIERADKVKAVHVKGVDPMLEMRLSALPSYVQGDAWSQFQAGKQQIIVGKGVADTLHATFGDWLTVIIPNKDWKIKLSQPKRIRLQISGILTLNSQLDHSFAMMPLADAQIYLQRKGDVSGLAIKVSDVFKAHKLVLNTEKFTNIHVKIRSWIDSYGYMYRDIQMIRTIIYLAMLLVIGVACFNIVSTLLMAVKAKSAAIGILRTMGAKNGLIRVIFIFYGLLAGLIGSVIGAIVGVLMALNLTTLVKKMETWLGYRLMSKDIYFIDFLPIELSLVDISSVLVTVLLLSLLASGYPAWRASHIDPARVLNSQ